MEQNVLKFGVAMMFFVYLMEEINVFIAVCTIDEDSPTAIYFTCTDYITLIGKIKQFRACPHF